MYIYIYIYVYKYVYMRYMYVHTIVIMVSLIRHSNVYLDLFGECKSGKPVAPKALKKHEQANNKTSLEERICETNLHVVERSGHVQTHFFPTNNLTFAKSLSSKQEL